MRDDVSRDAPHARIIDMTVYHVMTNSDLTEGRGRQYILATYADRTQALAHGRGAYVFGTDCPITEERTKVVKVDDNTYYVLGAPILVMYRNPAEIKARALTKLTDEEKDILGLT